MPEEYEMADDLTLKFSDIGLELTGESDGAVVSKIIDFNDLSRLFMQEQRFDSGLMGTSEGVCRMVMKNGNTILYYLVPTQFRNVYYHNEPHGHGLRDDSVETFEIWTPPLILRLKLRFHSNSRIGDKYIINGSSAYCWEGGYVTHDTKIYQFPFGNVLCGNGRSDYICWGRNNQDNLSTPRNLCEGMYDLVNVFWAARFNGHLTPNIYPLRMEEGTIHTIRDFMAWLIGKNKFPIEEMAYYSTMKEWMHKKDKEDNID
jgi:hypothetical protein